MFFFSELFCAVFETVMIALIVIGVSYVISLCVLVVGLIVFKRSELTTYYATVRPSVCLSVCLSHASIGKNGAWLI